MALARAVGVRFPRVVSERAHAGILETTREGSRHHDRLLRGSTLPAPKDVVGRGSKTGTNF